MKKKIVIETEKSPGPINTDIVWRGRRAKYSDARENNYKIAIYCAREVELSRMEKKKMSAAVASIATGTGTVIDFNEPEGELLLIFPE